MLILALNAFSSSYIRISQAMLILSYYNHLQTTPFCLARLDRALKSSLSQEYGIIPTQKELQEINLDTYREGESMYIRSVMYFLPRYAFPSKVWYQINNKRGI